MPTEVLGFVGLGKSPSTTKKEQKVRSDFNFISEVKTYN